MIENTALVAHFPDDQPAFPMISRALTVFPTLSQSPLGMLVSTRFGLLFGIRAWVEGDRASVERLAVSLGWKAGSPKHSPCDACVDKPCLTHCPVGAFDAHGYDYPKCQVELNRQMSEKRRSMLARRLRRSCRLPIIDPVHSRAGRVSSPGRRRQYDAC